MTGERSPEQLAGWIRANRAAYTREALDRAAADQGWSADQIAAAWGLVEGAEPPAQWEPTPPGGGAGDARAQRILLLLLLVPMTGLALLTEASLGPMAAGYELTAVVLVGMAVTVAVPVVAFVAVSRSNLPLGCAGLVGFVLLVGVAIFGSCLLTLNLASSFA